MDPIFWFDVSRIVLIIAGLSTALGGYGVLHFGKINSQNQNEKIAESNRIAAVANQDAAEANKVSAVANRDAAKAKLRASNAEAKSLENENKNKTLEISLQKEKQKTIKAQQELINLKKETQNIKLETDRIKSIRVVLIASYHGEFEELSDNSTYTNFNSIDAKLEMKINKNAIVTFLPQSNITSQKVNENLIQYRINYTPIDILNVNTLPIRKLTEIDNVLIRVQQQIKGTLPFKGFTQNENSRYDLIVIINGIEALNFYSIEKESGEFLNLEEQTIIVGDLFKNIYTNYKVRTGRDDK